MEKDNVGYLKKFHNHHGISPHGKAFDFVFNTQCSPPNWSSDEGEGKKFEEIITITIKKGGCQSIDLIIYFPLFFSSSFFSWCEVETSADLLCWEDSRCKFVSSRTTFNLESRSSCSNLWMCWRAESKSCWSWTIRDAHLLSPVAASSYFWCSLFIISIFLLYWFRISPIFFFKKIISSFSLCHDLDDILETFFTCWRMISFVNLSASHSSCFSWSSSFNESISDLEREEGVAEFLEFPEVDWMGVNCFDVEVKLSTHFWDW